MSRLQAQRYLWFFVKLSAQPDRFKTGVSVDGTQTADRLARRSDGALPGGFN